MYKTIAFRILILTWVVISATNFAEAQVPLWRASSTQSCDAAAVEAASAVGVPLPILKAIARVESGKSHRGQFVPWPWTVNVEGTGRHFETQTAAADYIRKSRMLGQKSIDAGCFQINLKWHGHHFRSIEHALEPRENALYAARFLRSLYLEFGDWNTATGAYHSRNAVFSKPYLSRFQRVLADLSTQQQRPDRAPVLDVNNTFPLLHGQSNSPEGGSLFPKVRRSNPGLFVSTELRG